MHNIKLSSLSTLACVYLIMATTDGFQLSMVATQSPFRIPKMPNSKITKSIPSSPPSFIPGSTSGITSSLISNLAVAALKLRLAEQTSVAADVTASSSDLLLRGQVGPVTVKGKSWASGLGLTCRAIEATVSTCELDMGRVLRDQKLVLTTPAVGTAMVALNNVDFGNFITHPLVKPPGSVSGDEDNNNNDNGIKFLKDDVRIDPTDGTVIFYGTYSNEKITFSLRRSSNSNEKNTKAIITAKSANISSEIRSKLTNTVSDFFNNMVLELDGTYLNFNDMMITSKGTSGPSIMFALDIKVRKFPSPGLEF